MLTKKSIIKMINDLSSNDEEFVNVIIDKLVSMDDKYIPLLIQKEEKQTWYYSAMALQKIGYPRIKNSVSQLLRWFMDINWPGAMMIIDLLLTVDHSILIPAIENALLEAEKDKDQCWVFGISVFLDRANITEKDFNSKELYKILEESEEWE